MRALTGTSRLLAVVGVAEMSCGDILCRGKSSKKKKNDPTDNHINANENNNTVNNSKKKKKKKMQPDNHVNANENNNTVNNSATDQRLKNIVLHFLCKLLLSLKEYSHIQQYAADRTPYVNSLNIDDDMISI